MSMRSAFLAYPGTPAELSTTLDAVCSSDFNGTSLQIHSWRENDIPGRFLADPILQNIAESDFLVADITRLNFNVTFEIGYAIGLSRRAVLVVNEALVSDFKQMSQVGIFDTIGYVKYANSVQLAQSLSEIDPGKTIRFSPDSINKKAPVYVLLPQHKGDAEIRLISRIKKARLSFRSFDPEEEGRLPAQKAIDDVAASHGVIVHLLSSARQNFFVHNIRAAFVAGLATAMNKELLLIQAGDEPVPLDYRDLVESYTSYAGFDSIIADFAPKITERLQSHNAIRPAGDTSLLAGVTFGASAAENEFRDLGSYYVPIDDFFKCKRGEIQVVAGRKGSGKTALFLQLRDDLRRIRTKVVLDLKPEGFQLIKLKDRVLDLLEEGTQAHTVTAFWEYLLLIEICHKVLVDDAHSHLTNHELYEPYRALAATYDLNSDLAEGDFAERMANLIDLITESLESVDDTGASGPVTLSTPQITELIHRHNISELREHLVTYLLTKDSIWILFDNLDKGWPPHGLREQDLLILRCLLDAFAKIERTMAKSDVEFHGIVFVRNDVYELLVSSSPDRGKVAHALLDWQDQDALRELVRKRIAFSGIGQNIPFEECWRMVFASHVGGEESSQYMIDRCLMRPRGLIDLATACRSHAVNRGHAIIEESDIRAGEAVYSNDVVNNVSFELLDVFPEGASVLYAFLESPRTMPESEVMKRLADWSQDAGRAERAFALLLWYGFFGIATNPEEYRFIYDMGYSQAKLRAHMERSRQAGRLMLAINPAFWSGLEIR